MATTQFPLRKDPQIQQASGTIDEALKLAILRIFESLNIRHQRLRTLEEAADYLHVSPGTIRNLVSEGRLMPVHLIRPWLFDIEDLDRLILENKHF